MAPPLPPEIAAQQPDPRQSAFAPGPESGGPGNAGPGGVPGPSSPAQVIQQIQGKVQELDAWAGEMKNLIGGFDPSLMPYLEQFGKIAMELLSAVKQKAERSGAASGAPTVPPQPPVNPAAGPPNPNA